MPNEDQCLILTVQRHRNMNATFLQQQLRSTTNTIVSTQIVRNQRYAVHLMYADQWYVLSLLQNIVEPTAVGNRRSELE